uniref:Secreted protein n=1 Tax=Trypanosoma vivax (strain Y486) TaxID=1055687 RepID=G0U3T3_TRYVY|nr:hypothetical protein TVY486_0907630 [Trypanosoma vivax Y486]
MSFAHVLSLLLLAGEGHKFSFHFVSFVLPLLMSFPRSPVSFHHSCLWYDSFHGEKDPFYWWKGAYVVYMDSNHHIHLSPVLFYICIVSVADKKGNNNNKKTKPSTALTTRVTIISRLAERSSLTTY